jgi:hypothetical protein
MRADLSSLGFYAFIAAAGLGAAYWASIPANEADADKVAIVRFEPSEVTSLTYEMTDGGEGSAAYSATATRAAGDSGRFWIVYKKAAKQIKVAPTDATTKSPVVETSEPATEERFLANKQINDIVASLNPLLAERDLGAVDEAGLAEYGLKDAKDFFTVTAGSKTFKLILGKKSYGSNNRFAMVASDAKKKAVLLINNSNIEALQRANLRLFQRDLTDFELDDVTHVSITAGDKSKKIAHIQRGNDGELTWSDEGENQPAKPSYGAWMDRVGKLLLISYADDSDTKKLEGQAPFLKLTYEKNGKSLGSVAFFKTLAAPPNSKPGDVQKPTPAFDYWVYSDSLGSFGKLAPPRIEPIEKDIGAILSQ